MRYDFAKTSRIRKELLDERPLPAGSPRDHRPHDVAKARSFKLRYPGRMSHSAIASRYLSNQPSVSLSQTLSLQ